MAFDLPAAPALLSRDTCARIGGTKSLIDVDEIKKFVQENPSRLVNSLLHTNVESTMEVER
jgi:hypothetical protein